MSIDQYIVTDEYPDFMSHVTQAVHEVGGLPPTTEVDRFLSNLEYVHSQRRSWRSIGELVGRHPTTLHRYRHLQSAPSEEWAKEANRKLRSWTY